MAELSSLRQRGRCVLRLSTDPAFLIMNTPTRLAFVVSHPIQYYVPLYQRLAVRKDVQIKVFYTWHAGQAQVHDRGFGIAVAWDIPLTEGYEHELVPNVATDPGTHHFFGLRNPTLVDRVAAWRPDCVHVTGWAWRAHLEALWAFRRRGVATLFRGDSHLLDGQSQGPRWWIKRTLLRRIYAWPTAFLYVGEANRAYYRAFGVSPDRLIRCPHSIEVERFAEPSAAYEEEAARWRHELGIAADRCVLLFAGKFEPKKRPLDLMHAVQESGAANLLLVLVGDGEQATTVKSIAAAAPDRFRVLPFQNQSRMPVVYRLGDLFVLPSAYGETWGLAVNEAMACGRAVVVSDRVGCARDVVDDSCGRVFPWDDLSEMLRLVNQLAADQSELLAMGRRALSRSRQFGLPRTESTLMVAAAKVLAP